MFGFGFGPLMVGRCLTWLHLSRLGAQTTPCLREPPIGQTQKNPLKNLRAKGSGQENRTPHATMLEKDFCDSAGAAVCP